MKKKILISGGNGFIGSYLKKSFIENGHSVVSIGRSKLNEICVDLAKNHIYHSDDYEYVEGTVANRIDSTILTEKTTALGWKAENNLLDYIKSKL